MTLFQAHWLLMEFSFLHLQSLWKLASPTPLRESLWTQGKPSSVHFSHSVLSNFLWSLGLQGDPTSPFWRKSVLNIHRKDWYWSWSSNTLATWCEELTHWKRPWCRERLRAGGEGADRGWEDWMALPTRWTWVWVSSGSWWWTGKPGILQSRGSQRVGHGWVTELNWI